MRVSSVDRHTWREKGRGPVYQLDVRTKVTIAIACSVMVVCLNNPAALGVLCVITAIYALSLRRFMVMAITYGVILAMMGTATACVKVMTVWLPAMDGFNYSVFINPFLRILVIINTVFAVALTIRIQSLLAVLKALRLPYYIYLPAAVMIRFIPSFIHDGRQIKDSLKIKGYVFSPAMFLMNPLFGIRLLFMPLVIRALRTADELGVAAELKGAGYGQCISQYRSGSFARSDWLAGAATLFFFAVAVVVEYRELTLFYIRA